MTDNLRNIAIIAHVDHGKTTLIDGLLRQSGTFRDNQEAPERVMDSHDLEKERGITILAKCTSILWEDTRINIIDTPGHADFGGEVERILSMVDGVVLLVDAEEGPLPQTKFVLSKALQRGLKPIVVINKVDRRDARPQEVVDEVFDLFVSLDATEAQLDFPILYASGRDGWCAPSLEAPRENLKPLLSTIRDRVPAPDVRQEAPFSMLVTLMESNPYLGRLLTGRVESGSARVNEACRVLNLEGGVVEEGRLVRLQTFSGVERVSTDRIEAGEIVSIAGLAKASVSDTVCSPEVSTPIASTPIDPPTIAVTISVNDAPFAGQEGTKVTSRMIRDRLEAEAETNVAIKISETAGGDAFEVGGRGELQLGVLIETMRREGFELSVSRPRVLYRTDPDTGAKLEPIEEVVVDVDEEFSGTVIEKLSARKGEMQDMRPAEGGKVRLTFHVPSRGLIGYQGEFLTDTRGTGLLNRVYLNHAPFKGAIVSRRGGALISNGKGDAVAYALFNLQERGVMFVSPGDKVYQGMIVGEHNRENDLEINILKGKQLTNVRASGTDEAIRLTPPRVLSLEDMIAYIADDELVEVTPQTLRLRKKWLDPHDRKRALRKGDA
ncbi:translational GTPase TypA [bacterium NHP-B]|nr:translational GTPase TypA [bacterium NHP-B]